jgi:Protein of unknown function (DUF3810)
MAILSRPSKLNKQFIGRWESGVDNRARTGAALRVAIVGLAAVAALVPTPEGVVERLYSASVYPVLQNRLTPVANGAPFALFDWLAGIVVLGWVSALVLDIVRHQGWARTALRCAARTLVLASGLYLAFLVCWGLNYRRVPLVEKIQFDSAAVSDTGALKFITIVIERLNALYEPAHTRLSAIRPTGEIDPRLADAFAQVQRDLGAARLAVPGRPKPSLLDVYFRRAAVDGMTDPYFLETLVAGDLLAVERPFVVAHEWSHLAGYAEESEASFVGWLTCVRAGEEYAYSGWLFLYGETIFSVSAADRRALPELGPGPRADRRAIAERFRRNVSPRVSAAGWIVYDRFLKANRVEAGAASYADVVRLVLGARFGPDWVPLRR